MENSSEQPATHTLGDLSDDEGEFGFKETADDNEEIVNSAAKRTYEEIEDDPALECEDSEAKDDIDEVVHEREECTKVGGCVGEEELYEGMFTQNAL